MGLQITSARPPFPRAVQRTNRDEVTHGDIVPPMLRSRSASPHADVPAAEVLHGRAGRRAIAAGAGNTRFQERAVRSGRAARHLYGNVGQRDFQATAPRRPGLTRAAADVDVDEPLPGATLDKGSAKIARHSGRPRLGTEL